MEFVNKSVTYFHTIRYLRPIQIFGRLWFRFYRPRPRLNPAPALRELSGSWVLPAAKASAMVSPAGFRFLNEFHELDFPEGWNSSKIEKLWLYNLHYFDVLNGKDAAEKRDWYRSLIMRWIADNAPGHGNGWEPYPISLRIVNWIKWALAGNPLQKAWVESLATQVRYLSGRLEWHLLGNHLFANLKALVFAGVYFEGEEAERWLLKGLEILDREIDEQVLSDGGHFELSPMYHSIILEDLLDLRNLFSAYPDALPGEWCGFPEKLGTVITKMLRWLEAMTHPDGEIALFNDSAFGIASPPAELRAYAKRLGLEGTPVDEPEKSVALSASGYIRCQRGSAVLIADVGQIGPDYLPGHAHADSLGFEMSLFGQRLFVDSGVSCYGNSQERLRQRSTAAHNTLTINDKDSSEVWGGFRVARRAYPQSLQISKEGGRTLIRCAHDGFKRLPGRPIHKRQWTLADGLLRIEDVVEGQFSRAIARYHLHPEVVLSVSAAGGGGDIELPDGRRLVWQVNGGVARDIPSTYHPHFGVSLPNRCLEIELKGGKAELVVAWKG